MLVYALVPARSGSKGLPDKNVLPVDGHPLIAYSIAFGLKLGVGRVLVSTDSVRYAGIARAFGAECPFLRADFASSDSAREEDILADLDARLPRHGIPLPDIWVWLKPTNPFRSISAVHQAIEILATRPDVDSVRLVTEADARLQVINDEGYLEPLLSAWPDGYSKIPRDRLQKAYYPFNLEVFRHRGWVAWKQGFMGRRIVPLPQPRITGLDIDDRDGFEIVKALIEARPRADIVARHLVL